MHSVREVNE